jgi:hypothetical protein
MILPSNQCCDNCDCPFAAIRLLRALSLDVQGEYTAGLSDSLAGYDFLLRAAKHLQ